MSRQQSLETYPPLTEAELKTTEKRARQLPEAWPREEILSLIAEVRRARAALQPTAESVISDPGPDALDADPDYTPPGGRMSMAEWQAVVERLKAERAPLPEPRPLTPAEQEERKRRWEELRVQLGWDTQSLLTPEQEAEINTLIRQEIKAHRREKHRKREQHAGGR